MQGFLDPLERDSGRDDDPVLYSSLNLNSSKTLLHEIACENELETSPKATCIRSFEFAWLFSYMRSSQLCFASTSEAHYEIKGVSDQQTPGCVLT